MESALDWWYNKLSEVERQQFPIPIDKNTILKYFNNPSKHHYNPSKNNGV